MNGIRPDDRLPRNAKYLQNCFNVTAGPFGIRPARDIVQPITNAALSTALITKAYPWPQLFRLREGAVLLDKSAFFGVSADPTSNWTLTGVTPYDFTTYNWDTDAASSFSMTTDGGDWHVADLGVFKMFFNGTSVLFTTGFSEKLFGVDDVTIETGATFQDDRVFLGGFDNDDYDALADWDTYLATLTGDFLSEAAKLTPSALDQNWVWWSSHGAPDALRFFSLDYMKYMSLAATPNTGFDDDNPFWKTLAQRRESFAMPMPTPGKVLRMMQLGNAMVAYTQTGVHSLVPVDTGEVSTFGLQEVAGFGHHVGVKQGSSVRASAGGCEQVHAMIDEANDLWILTPERGGVKAEKRGYRNLFSQHANWLVHYDPSEREFHFTSDTRSYRLGESGNMSLDSNLPTTVYFGRSNNTSAPIGVLLSGSLTSSFVIVTTDWFDAGPDVKNPQLVRVWLDTGETDASDWTVRVFVKLVENQEKTVIVSGSTPDARGLSQLDASGSAFRVELSHANRTVATLQNLEAEFDNGERRKIKTWLT